MGHGGRHVSRRAHRRRRADVVRAHGAAGRTATPRSSATSDLPSVAVLPFTTIGEGDRYFADGITEAVTTELGRVAGLRVIASSSTFAYRDKTGFRDIARDLGVGLVVRGAVQRAAGMVRIDVSLVDTRNDTALWSERYSRELTNILTVQDDISRQIATTLAKTFGADHRRRRRHSPRRIPTRTTPICAASGTSRDAHPPRRTWPIGAKSGWRQSRSSNGRWLGSQLRAGARGARQRVHAAVFLRVH